MSGSPTRFTSGFTQDAIFQPLGQIGTPNPFFYATYADDFLPYVAGNYVVTAASGSVAASDDSGTGGRILMTTDDIDEAFAAIQPATADFAYVPSKKLAYLVRVNLTDVTASAMMAGLIQTSTTPFIVTDGIYFFKEAGSNAVQLCVMHDSVLIGSVDMPSVENSSAFLDGADQDLGFYIDRLGNVKAFMGYHLVGSKNQNRTALGPMATIWASDMTDTINTLPISPTVVVQASGATAQTMSVDFQYAAQER